jgi:hypothetical protein
MHQRLALHDLRQDPIEYWHTLIRLAPAKERAKLRRSALRAQQAYDAAQMLRKFYFHLSGELLLNPDEIFDGSDKSWKKRVFGKWPTLSYSRADLAAELRWRDLHPHQVHIVVEGESEEVVCRRVLETVADRPLAEMGITIQRLNGIGSAALHQEMLRAVKSFPRYLILVADREGEIEREVERLKEAGVLSDETTFLWDSSFEEANFRDNDLAGDAVLVMVPNGSAFSSAQQLMGALTLYANSCKRSTALPPPPLGRLAHAASSQE